MKKIFCIFILFFTILSCARKLRASKEFRDSLEEIQFDWNQEERRALVYDPKFPKKQPVLFVLHGGGGKPETMIGIDEEYFLKSAKEHGIIIVYPQGNDKKWNDLRKDPSNLEIKDRDDVGFIKELLRTLSNTKSIDESKIYLTGISNGGMMSLRLACESSKTFKEIFPITANMPLNSDSICKPETPVSITIFNGTEDPLVPYKGGTVKVLGKSHGEVISTEDSIQFWASKDNCRSKNVKELTKKFTDDKTKIFHHQWDCNSKRVELYEIRGGGHTWPGGIQFLPEMMVGITSREIKASQIIIDRILEK
jgi:polyhydroxybutyrate depolymerase